MYDRLVPHCSYTDEQRLILIHWFVALSNYRVNINNINTNNIKTTQYTEVIFKKYTGLFQLGHPVAIPCFFDYFYYVTTYYVLQPRNSRSLYGQTPASRNLILKA